MTHRMKFLAGVLALSGGLAATQGAQASPQVLGLQASLRPTVMQCTAAGCRADLSAFCLEQHRPDPRVGTVYHPAPNAPITVVVISKSGAIQRTDGSKYLSFVDERGFASITANLPASALAGLDVAAVAIEVGKDASL